ncbi:lysA, partial [Mycobacteroides abscessus]|nr:lysA [Mycobacteroides abscessus]
GGIDNFWAVKNAIEARGVRVALSYIPRWYWEKIGKPDLSGVPGLIQSSYVNGTAYASVLYPGDDSPRWAAFGGKTPDILQFTDKALVAGKSLDANAFRGTLAQLKALLGAQPETPGAPDYEREIWDQLRLRWEMLGWQTLIEAFAEVRDKVLGTSDHGKTGVRP